MRIYRWEFFPTEAEAKAYQKKEGGKYISRKRNRYDYNDYIIMANKDKVFADNYPYAVVWAETV